MLTLSLYIRDKSLIPSKHFTFYITFHFQTALGTMFKALGTFSYSLRGKVLRERSKNLAESMQFGIFWHSKKSFDLSQASSACIP